ncbi:MAG: DUF721 domain-containing protein [Gammaproteobacteria bacterium]|nr:DUF721 domain-containing protein [Gammaproteobacteria bacterium]
MPQPPKKSGSSKHRQLRRKMLASDYVARLPALQQLSTAQRVLIKLAPCWHSWCEQQLPANTAEQATLTHFNDGNLVITCDNAAMASRIRHQQDHLVTFFNHQGLSDVRTISVRIDHTTQYLSPTAPNNTEACRTAADSTHSGKRENRTSKNSMEALQQCHKNISNEPLAKALQRLLQTLREQS